MPQCLAKRYAGHEQEILRDISLHGSTGAMMKWGASFLAWDKYIETLKETTIETDNGLPQKDIRINELIFSGRQSLAEQLVEQFTNKVVSLENRCREQESRIAFLEKQLSMYKDRNDEQLADKMIKALQLVR